MALLIYITTRFAYRFQEFLKHWYLDSFTIISHSLVSFLERLDRIFALQVTLRHIFEPLYQDRTVLGYFLGFVFRSLRLILAIAVYVLVVSLFVMFYFLWVLLLPYVVYKTIVAYGLITKLQLWNL